MKYIFYLIFAYIILKIVRSFIDPLFENSTNKPTSKQTQTATPHEKKQPNKPKPTLGEYIEYEEVK